MNFKTFDELVERETKRMKDVMCDKSADYAAGGDKLFNFKLAAEVDGVTPIEALRGMWLKHRTSLRQGLDELMEGKPCRSEDWWIEKLTDDRNYNILLQALLIEKYFTFVCPAGWEIKLFIPVCGKNDCGWLVEKGTTLYLHKDLTLHEKTSWDNHEFGEAPGYWPTKEAAEKALTAYIREGEIVRKRVYVAGKLNGMACDYIKNVHRMIIAAEKVRKAGFAVFVPGLDFLQGLVFGNWDYPDYFDNSQPWLDASDAIFLTPGWETSEGTKKEIERAKAQNIPVYDDLNILIKELGDMR